VLPESERLRSRRDFTAVYNRKKSWANALLVLYVRRYDTSGPDMETRRFGFSVSKKVGKAHDRNGVKRRLRAICRESGGAWRRGFDAVFVARAPAAEAGYADLASAVHQLMERAGLSAVAASAATATRPPARVSDPPMAAASGGHEPAVGGVSGEGYGGQE